MNTAARRGRIVNVGLALVLFGLALGPRLAAAHAYTDPQLYSEERLYNRYAVPWAKGEGAEPREKPFPWHPLGSFTHRPPAYALFVGLIYRAAGTENYPAVREAQAWLDASSAVWVFLIGLLLFEGLAGRAVGFAAGLATARYDFQLEFVARLLSEPVYIWLTLAFLAAALLAVKRRQPAISGAAAYVLGWANLTRPFLLPAIPGYLLWLALAPALPRRRAHVLAALLGITLAIAPVTWRNWQFHHRFILISTNSGYTLFKSLSELDSLRHPEELGTEEAVGALALGEVAEQAEFRRRALDYMRRHPDELPAILGRKAEILLAANQGNKISHVLMPTPVDDWLYPLVLFGALASLLVLPRAAWHGRLLLLGVILSQYLVSLLANAEIRYRVPMVPLLTLLAAWAVWGLADRAAAHARAVRAAADLAPDGPG